MKRIILTLIIAFLVINTNAQDFVNSVNKSAFNYYKKIESKDKNVVFSPVSINSALALAYIGSKSNTFNEISNSLFFEKDVEKFCKNYTSFQEQNFFNKKYLSLFNANSLWVSSDLNLEDNFKLLSQKYFNSSAFKVNFFESLKTKDRINKWVSNNTNNNIKDLLNESDIDQSTKLVLLNAVYFKSNWDKKFKKKNNTIEKFEYKRKRFVESSFMNSIIYSWYYENNHFIITEIPYMNNQLSFVVIMPKSLKRRKLKAAYKDFNYNLYREYLQKKERKGIKISIPKFETKSEYNLNNVLQSIGIKDAFDSKANFDGISFNQNLYINKVIHQAKINVNEEGTEAAAATAVIMRKTSIAISEIEVKLNKPFVYLIKNNKTNLIYFIGKVNNPNL